MVDLSAESKVWEHLALLVLFVTLLVMGPANIWDKKIDHTHPYGLFAQDAFIFTSYQYYLSESGNWHQLAPYLARGYTDIIQSQPSVLEILSVLLAQATGLGFFMTIYVIVMLLVLLAVFCFYFLVRSFNPKVALLSLPLNVLIFSAIFIQAFTWGNWPFFVGSSMFVLFFWCLNNIKKRLVPALGSLTMAAIAFGHTSEYIFIAPLLGFILLVDVVSRTFQWQEWKRIAGMVLGSVLIAGYYLIIFSGTFLHHAQAQFLTPKSQGLSLFVSITTPGVLLAVAVGIGAAIGVLMLRKHRVLQIAFVLLLIGFTNYIGTGKRGLETRFLWPIYLSVFFGLLLYLILSWILKHRLSLRVCALISIAFTVFFAHQYYLPISSHGLLPKESWQAMEWVGHETPRNATIFYFLGDAYDQAGVLFNTQRLTSVILPDEYISLIRSNQLRRMVKVERVSDRTNAYPYRKGLFSFGFHQLEDAVESRVLVDLCSFDYYVLDKISYYMIPLLHQRIPEINPDISTYNLPIAHHFMTKANFTKAYENGGVLVLKNPQPGGECIVQ